MVKAGTDCRTDCKSYELRAGDMMPGGCPQYVAAELERWLMKNEDPFPYFFLVAMEAGSLMRAAALLLLAHPAAWLLRRAGGCDHAALRLYVFVACAGLRMVDIEAVGRAVLPHFFAADLRAGAWKAFSSFAASNRIVISALPRAMLHAFVRQQLGAAHLIAPELRTTSSGRCLGLLLQSARADQGHRPKSVSSAPPTTRSKEQHYILGNLVQFIDSCTLKQDEASAADDSIVCMSDLDTPVAFHDGRLVQRPTSAMALLMLLWMPLGFMLAVVRIMVCLPLPCAWWSTAARLLALRVVIKGKVPVAGDDVAGHGLLLVCNHRTLLDPIFVCMGLRRPVTAATYSVSRLSEVLSPIATQRLERDADRDLGRLRQLIEEGRDVVVCPEGTTSRAPLLLRFSALFAQVSDRVVPVAIRTHAPLFHGTSARGFKALDPFFFLMNPVATYELTFLPMLPPAMTCGAGGRCRLQVANYVQQLIASTLNFRCSSFTRPDKYRFLAGTDGSVRPSIVAEKDSVKLLEN